MSNENTMKSHLQKVGNSKFIRVDAEYLNKYDVKEGDILHFTIDKIERKREDGKSA